MQALTLAWGMERRGNFLHKISIVVEGDHIKMMKFVKKYVKLRLLLVSILLPIGLNIYGLICFLRSLAGAGYGIFPKVVVEKSIDFACYSANWPSILVKIYPYTVSQNGEIDYDIFGWQNLGVSLVNTLGWYLIGLLTGFLIKKYRKNRIQKES